MFPIGVLALHRLGIAHTDIKVSNVFVETETGTAFLDDLEYVLPLESPCREDGTGYKGTAREQDLNQLAAFIREVNLLQVGNF